MKKRLQLGLSYFGGKQNQAEFMQSLFPESFTQYCEPFGGTMKNFLNSDINCSNVIFNDINYYQANLMMGFKYPKTFLKAFRKQLRHGGHLFHPKLNDSIKYKQVLETHYRGVFDTFKAKFLSVKVNQTGQLKRVNWEDAVMYAFCLSHSIKGIPLKSFVYAHPTFSKAKFLIVLKHLRHHIEQRKFKSVRYFTGDAMNIIKQQDSEDSFYVVDPGYVDMEHYYRNAGKKGKREKVGKRAVKPLSDLKMHINLSNTLKEIKGKFMLCYYYHPILEKLYPQSRFKWVIKEYRRPSASSSELKRDLKGTELLILNYGKELEQRLSNKQHLLENAKAVMPTGAGRRHRASYSLEFKHRIIMMLESGSFKKKEVLEAFGIKSYNTIAKWLRGRHQIERTVLLMKEAQTYLGSQRTNKSELSEKLADSGLKRLSDKAKNLIADLRHQSILSNKTIREMFAISNDCVESTYNRWKEEKQSVPIKLKIARLRTYWHTMAA